MATNRWYSLNARSMPGNGFLWQRALGLLIRFQVISQFTFQFENKDFLPINAYIILQQLVSQYGTNNEITSLVDQYDWKFVPISNPDGYAYTWSNVCKFDYSKCIKLFLFIFIAVSVFLFKDRMWRKNRAVIEGSSCQGVDINRNFPPAFGGTGSSADPCSESKLNSLI